MAAKILIVDDDPIIRELIGIHLRNAGYEVRTAEDAIEGGYGVLRDPPDLIITDVNMPHLDGFEFIAALRGERTLRNIPVIFLTSQQGIEHVAKELGAVGFVPKPIRADQLLAVVAANVPGGVHPLG
jgi:DNA-binding response OmpR family regulator